MSDERTVRWEWGDYNLAWTVGRELITSLGPTLGLGGWFVVVPQNGRPRAVIPPTKTQVIEWLNAHDARLELSRAPTISEQDLAPGLNQVTVAGPSRLGKFLGYSPGQLLGVYRSWVWNLAGHQPKVEPPGYEAVVNYLSLTGTPDVLIMAQLHANPDWPAFVAFPQSGDTVVNPWEPVLYDLKNRVRQYVNHVPLSEFEWAHGYDWSAIVQGVRTIQTQKMRQRSPWNVCTNEFCNQRYYLAEKLDPLGDFEEGWKQTEEPTLGHDDAELLRRTQRRQPAVPPYLPSGKCPKCGSVAYPCAESDEKEWRKATSYYSSMADEETAGHMAEIMDWQPSIFD